MASTLDTGVRWIHEAIDFCHRQESLTGTWPQPVVCTLCKQHLALCQCSKSSFMYFVFNILYFVFYVSYFIPYAINTSGALRCVNVQSQPHASHCITLYFVFCSLCFVFFIYILYFVVCSLCFVFCILYFVSKFNLTLMHPTVFCFLFCILYFAFLHFLFCSIPLQFHCKYCAL